MSKEEVSIPTSFSIRIVGDDPSYVCCVCSGSVYHQRAFMVFHIKFVEKPTRIRMNAMSATASAKVMCEQCANNMDLFPALHLSQGRVDAFHRYIDETFFSTSAGTFDATEKYLEYMSELMEKDRATIFGRMLATDRDPPCEDCRNFITGDGVAIFCEICHIARYCGEECRDARAEAHVGWCKMLQGTPIFAPKSKWIRK